MTAFRSHAIDLALTMWRTKPPRRRRVRRGRRRRRRGWARRRVMRLDHAISPLPVYSALPHDKICQQEEKSRQAAAYIPHTTKLILFPPIALSLGVTGLHIDVHRAPAGVKWGHADKPHMLSTQDGAGTLRGADMEGCGQRVEQCQDTCEREKQGTLVNRSQGV